MNFWKLVHSHSWSNKILRVSVQHCINAVFFEQFVFKCCIDVVFLELETAENHSKGSSLT